MEQVTDHRCLCCLRGIMPTISRKWAICIISALGHREHMRFNEIVDNCEHISPKTLSDILRDLQDAGLVERQSFHEIPPRVEYSLTDDGKTLREALVPLLKWAKERNQRYNYTLFASCLQAPDP
ncbi:MAG: helix-turn-helix domain-containing protein [Methanoregulaceae archaeon]